MEITNQKDFSISFEFNADALDGVSRGKFRIEPQSGILSPRETLLILFEYTSGTRPEIFAAQAYLNVFSMADENMEQAEDGSNSDEEIIAIDPPLCQQRLFISSWPVNNFLFAEESCQKEHCRKSCHCISQALFVQEQNQMH